MQKSIASEEENDCLVRKEKSLNLWILPNVDGCVPINTISDDDFTGILWVNDNDLSLIWLRVIKS